MQEKSVPITVLMSVYNGETYLRESIESILNQTVTAFEFLIVNDGSTDSSRNIILSYKDPRIRLIDNEVNMGLTKSLNKGLKLAKGKYIARMDMDDISMPERLEKQYEFMENNPEVTVLGSWAWIIDKEGKVTGDIKTLTSFDCILVELLFTNPLIHSSTFFEKNFIHTIGDYNEKFERTQDYDLWIRVVKNKGKIVNIPLSLLKYRNHIDNVTNIQSDRQEELALEAIQYAYNTLINQKMSIKKLTLMRNFFFYQTRTSGYTEKLKIILFLRQLKKILKLKFIKNQEATNYLDNRINSIIDSRTNSNLEKTIIKKILLK